MIVKQTPPMGGAVAELQLQFAGAVDEPPAPPPPHLHPGVVGVLQALADPMRLEIVRRLASCHECPCGALAQPISKSTLSHHLHVLRAAGIVVQREEGTRRMTSLDREGLECRFPGLLDAVLASGGAEPAPGG